MKSLRPTRRDVLRLAGIGAAGIVLGCGDNEPQLDDSVTAVVEPEADSFLIAAWSSYARSLAIEVRAGADIVDARAIELSDKRATIEIGGLAPATSYQVSIVADTGAQLAHHVRTAPRPDDPRPVRIAVSADVDPYPEFESDIFDQLAAASPELFVSLGDFPYTDNGPPAMTVDEYRERHVMTRAAPRVRALLGAVGVRAIYDDHEFRNDWDAMFATVEASRYAAAMQVWDEFWPLRAPRDNIRYRSWRWGAHLECFLLDCRRFRSANAALDDSAKTMLGETQLRWLLDGLRASTATFKLVFTSVPLDFGLGFDHWSGFTTERGRLFDAIAGVPGVLFVSADQHFFAAQRHARGIREFQVGPLARGLVAPETTPPGVVFRASRFNFGLVDVDAETLRFSGVGTGGEVFYNEALTVRDLTPAS